MTHYIYSTLATGMQYTVYVKDNKNKDFSIPKKFVRIAGGAGVADKNLITPKGVMTKVTDEELEALKECKVFNTHVRHGFIKIESKIANPDVKSEDMNPNDVSRPLTDSDFEKQKDGTTKLKRGKSN